MVAMGLVTPSFDAQAILRRLELPVGTLQDRNFENINSFYANLVGRLDPLSGLFAQRAEARARAMVREVAGTILLRVSFLAPGFPFNQLLEEFDEQEDKEAAKRVVADAVDEAVSRFCPQASGSGGGIPAAESLPGSLSRGGTPSSEDDASSGSEATGSSLRIVSQIGRAHV